jgi:hypothetical protein
LYSKSAEHDDAGQALPVFMCVLVQHLHLAHHIDSTELDDTGHGLSRFVCLLVRKAPHPIRHHLYSAGSVCVRSLAGIVGSNPAWPWCLSLVNVEFFEVEVSGQGCSTVQNSHTECCDCEASYMRWHWLTVGCSAMGTHFIKSSLLFRHCSNF